MRALRSCCSLSLESVRACEGRDRRVGAVARAQQLRDRFHRAEDERGHLLPRAEGEELAGLLEDQDLVAVGVLRCQIARDGERLACLRGQRQERLPVDGVQFVEDDPGDRPVDFEELQALVEVDLGAVDGAKARKDLAARVGALAERERFDPGLGLLRAQLEVLRGGDTFRGNAQVQGHSYVNV